MLPFTPITAEYLTPIDWVKFEYSILSVALSDKVLFNFPFFLLSFLLRS